MNQVEFIIMRSIVAPTFFVRQMWLSWSNSLLLGQAIHLLFLKSKRGSGSEQEMQVLLLEL